MQTPVALMQETIWFDRLKYEQDLEHYQMFVHNNLPVLSEAGDAAAKPKVKEEEAKKKEKSAAQPKVKEETKQDATETNTLTSEIEKARRAIESTLSGLSTSVSDHLTSSDGTDVSSRVDALESENRALRELLSKLTIRLETLEARLVNAEGGAASAPCQAAPATKEEKKETEEEDDDDDDDDMDMFGSSEDEDEETEEEKKIREEKLAIYHAKKAGKKAVIAKSSLTLNVKPWDDETDMKKLEESVRSIVMDGLVWGGSKLVPVAFGIKMLQILAVVEDAKVSTDDLQEQIAEFEDYIQSSDIAAFNKI